MPQKKKLLIVVGAGASVPFGVPSVGGIDDLMSEWAQEYAPLTYQEGKSLYDWVKEQMESYLSGQVKEFQRPYVDFESVLFALQNISNLLGGGPFAKNNYHTKPFVGIDAFPDVFDWFARQHGQPTSNTVNNLQRILTDRLLKYLRETCLEIGDSKASEISDLECFFSELKEGFDIGFINLNYDDVILQAMPDLDTGFDRESGEFERGRLFNGEWNFCYHVHGSVHFDMVGDSMDLHTIKWKEDLNSSFEQNSIGRGGRPTGEGFQNPTSNIIAGLDKTNKILGEPFRNYFMITEKLVYDSDAILFVGYGFQDQHINSVFPFIRKDQDKTRNVCVIDLKPDDFSVEFNHDYWTIKMGETVPFNRGKMGNGQYTLPSIAGDHKRNRTFHQSHDPNYPLAIWYNGLTDAYHETDRILWHLGGGDG